MSAPMVDLRRTIRSCQIIDNHAHNILRPQQLRVADLLTITTEASGDALKDTSSSLAHLRAVRQLRALYELPISADWEDILQKRQEILSHEEFTRIFMQKCFQGTHTILVDDGLDSGANIQPYRWHDQFTVTPCKRIVRIETIASDILQAMHGSGHLPVGVALADETACDLAWVEFISRFERAMLNTLADPEVVGFKSVICYRTGLSVTIGRDTEVSKTGLWSFSKHFLPDATSKGFRVESKGMNDALVISTCKLIAAHQRDVTDSTKDVVAKPFQFHTGLGDKDISLSDSNPACLQPLIEAFPTVPFILLHSAYPYTQQAGYLATVYKNAFLDLGEVFPMVNRDGQEAILRQALEITPTSKLLWSTDGHHFPETFFLANLQGRQAMEKVVCEYVEKEDWTELQAMGAVKDILFENANRIYGLGLKLPDDMTRYSVALSANAATSIRTSGEPPSQHAYSNFVSFKTQHPSIRYIMVQWLDYHAIIRSRCFPRRAFETLLKSEKPAFAISKGNLGTLQNDQLTPVCDPVGKIDVEPEIETLLPYKRIATEKTAPDMATVMASFTESSGQPHILCPRAALKRVVDSHQQEFGLELLVGFELEITFCQRREDAFEPYDSNHAWGTFSDVQAQHSFPMLFQIADALEEIGIEVQQIHSEAGQGQYEFVLPPYSPMKAVDKLVQTRQCVQHIASSLGLRATMHPAPFAGVGSAAHAHISLSSADFSEDAIQQLNMSWASSLLQHVRALCAITMPQPVSYARVGDGRWTCGSWVAWGEQNREVPLRRVDSRWEVRCLDGMANPYLALSAILTAGLLGLRDRTGMGLGDCRMSPALLSDTQRIELGITEKLPVSLDEALTALEADADLASAMGNGMIQHFIALKKAEQAMLARMQDSERRIWLMERY